MGGWFMKITRRLLARFVAGASVLPLFSRTASAQTYPKAPVRLLVPFPAGGQIEIIARITAQWLSDRLGQQFIVDNRPGGGGNIATEAVIQAPPDGQTLLLAGGWNAVNASLFEKLNFDFTRDTAAIASINRIPVILAGTPSFSVSSVSDLIAYAKANPGKLNIGTPAKGTAPYMAGVLLKMTAGIDFQQIPYRGDAPL